VELIKIKALAGAAVSRGLLDLSCAADYETRRLAQQIRFFLK
jgi:hypothetical protein